MGNRTSAGALRRISVIPGVGRFGFRKTERMSTAVDGHRLRFFVADGI